LNIPLFVEHRKAAVTERFDNDDDEEEVTKLLNVMGHFLRSHNNAMLIYRFI
jgi:hypothetical protein